MPIDKSLQKKQVLEVSRDNQRFNSGINIDIDDDIDYLPQIISLSIKVSV